MVEYKYRVIDDNNKVEERIFNNFEQAYNYAVSSGALLPFIFEYTYKDGIEWDIYDDCPVEDGEDTSEIVWSWDDTWDKEKAISQVEGRHYLEDDVKEPVDESYCEEELDDSILEKDDIDKVCPKCGKAICECDKQVVECNKAARDPKILEAALGEAIKLEDEELDECNLSEKADDPKLQVARELAQTDMFKDWPANLLYFTVINAYQQDVYSDNATGIEDSGIKAKDVKAQDIIDWVGNLDEWILEWGYEFSNNQVKQLIKKSPVLSDLIAKEYYSYLDDDSKLARNVNAAVNFIFEDDSEKDENLDFLSDLYLDYKESNKNQDSNFSDALIAEYEESLEETVPEDLADNRQPAKEINNEVVSEPVDYKKEVAKEKGIDESLSQEISADYKYASEYYGIPELQQYVEEWYEANYPDWILPEFAGDVIYSEKYWNEFEAWLKANKNIDLEAIRNSKNVEEGLTTAPATSDQELQGADCAVVDCQGDNKVVAHSEDEKPLDCKMEKKPLEKPLTEDFEETAEDTTTDVVNGSSETEPAFSPEPEQKDGQVEEAAKKVMKSYQDANRWLDSIKESVYYDLSCPVLANYIHEIAHKMPIEFDAFGTILHTANYEIPYPATEDLDGKPENIAEAIDATLTILDTIKDSLNEFIKITDENYHGMSCSAEELLMHIEAEYPMLYRLLKNAEKYINDTVSFEKYVCTLVENKDKLLD